MARPVRSLLAVSFALLAACATKPDPNPPTASSGVPFTRATAAAVSTSPAPLAVGVDWRMQALYLPTDVKGAGPITGIRLVRGADNATAVTCPNVAVRLGHSTLSTLGATFASNVDASALTTVAVGTLSIPVGTNGTWFDVPFPSAYEYDGVESLVLDLETPAACSGTITLGTLNTASQRLLSSAADTDATTSQHDPTTGTVDALAPAATFQFAGGEDRVLAGAGAGNIYPFANTPRRVQMLELASDIAAGAGPITSIGFEAATVTTAATYTYTLRLGLTTKATLDAAWDSNSTSWVTVATSVTVTFPPGAPVGTWVWLPMPAGPFFYDGTSNVVVDVTTTGNDLSSIRIGTRTGARVLGVPGTSSGGVDSAMYHIAFRFQGATIFATRPPLLASPNIGTGAASQVQELFRPVQMGSSGVVTRIALRAAAATVPATVPIRIYLGQTAKSLFVATDTYASNMDTSVLAFSGTASIPGGLSRGDWIEYPIANGFRYDATQSLVLTIMHDDATPATNTSVFHNGPDTIGLGVGRLGNPGDLTGTPMTVTNGVIDVRIGIQ